ncbi:Protein CBG07374 [Caenorhabditis briggsae]|uniref:Protein CBG07374 n=1 Tax=Caenorhabditis briggsae TaxID=6238 RepID=A8X4X0_CAEBR|nr:Protein CBG07374 [Caenorhabditis briggsae]CAP27680.2 Protein CBG07374 [Caenorhabditis briggsae]
MTPQTPRGRFCNNGSVSSNRKINENILKVSGEWIQGYMVKEKNAKKIVKSFMTHILINITSPPENIRKFTIRTSRNTKSGYEELPADVTHEIISMSRKVQNIYKNYFVYRTSKRRTRFSSLKSNVSTNGIVSELMSLKNGVPSYRALVRNQPFQSTSSSHPGPQKSQMHLMTFRKRRNTRGFGSVCLFMIRGGQVYVLIEEYGSAAALRLDFSKLARNTQRLARSTKLFADNNCDSLIVKCTNLVGLTLIPTSDVLSTFLSIQFDGNTYFCPIRYSPSVVR